MIISPTFDVWNCEKIMHFPENGKACKLVRLQGLGERCRALMGPQAFDLRNMKDVKGVKHPMSKLLQKVQMSAGL